MPAYRLPDNWLSATRLLLLMILIFVGTFFMNEASFWVQMLRSGAEAGIIGGLADWFAVVAIFRHPLGIPLPHTAVLRNSKDDFADGIDKFITDNFSDREAASDYIKEKMPAKWLAEKLTQTENTKIIANTIMKVVLMLMKPNADIRIRLFLTKIIIEELKDVNVLPTIGQMLDHLYRRELHQDLIDELINFAKKFIEDNPGYIQQKVSEGSRSWIPAFVDRAIAQDLEEEILTELEELAERKHQTRLMLDRKAKDLIHDFQQGRLNVDSVRNWWLTFVNSEHVGHLISGLWDAIRNGIATDGGMNARKFESKLAQIIGALGNYLAEDDKLQMEIDARLAELSGSISPAVVDMAAEYLKSEIEDWPANKVADKLEAAVGKELQYIRINGTVLGCCIGVLLFIAVEGIL